MASQRLLTRLLFAVSIVAALASGVAATLWVTRREPAAPPAAPVAPAAELRTTASIPAAPVETPVPAADARTDVFINGIAVSTARLDELQRTYGVAPPPGRYWYDQRSGLYGRWGHETAGYIRSGHDFGELPPDASAGNTGVFINGREINLIEARFFQQLFGAVYPGQWWLDSNGNVGLEGSALPLANVVAALQQAQRAGTGGYRWRDNINGFSGGAEGGCVWVNIPGGSYTGSGC